MTSMLGLLIAIVLASMLYLSSSLPNNFSKTVIVDKFGKGQFISIQEAIESVPKGNNKWFHIFVKPGTYVETVSIEEEYIFLEGSGHSITKIFWDDGDLFYNYRLPPTFSVYANNFVGKDISFMNAYNEESKTNISTPTVAAAILGDRVAFYNCSFIGLKWTLNDKHGRHYYNSCYIEGAIDFIWGKGTSVFENCKINATAKQLRVTRYITAQGRKKINETNGFVFIKGLVVGTGKVFLGRPDPLGPFSRVIFSEMTFSSVVDPKGWDAGLFVGYERALTYVEAGCKGVGARTSRRAKWVRIIKKANSSYLQQFTVKNFIDQDKWIAKTRFP